MRSRSDGKLALLLAWTLLCLSIIIELLTRLCRVGRHPIAFRIIGALPGFDWPQQAKPARRGTTAGLLENIISALLEPAFVKGSPDRSEAGQSIDDNIISFY